MRTRMSLGLMLLAAAAMPHAGWAQARSASRVAVQRLGSYLGIGVEDIDAEKAKQLKLKEDRGALITSVEPDGPAAKAGIKEGDVVMNYNGTPVEGRVELQRLVSETPAGREVKIEVWRNGAMQTLTATIAERKNWSVMVPSLRPIPNMPVAPPMPVMPGMPAMPEMPNIPYFTLQSGVLGITGEALGPEPQFAEFFGVKRGVLVKAVTRNSAAEKAGIKAGDVIVKIGDQEISSTRDITMALRGAHGAKTVVVMRNKKEMPLTVTIEEGGRVRASVETVWC